MILFFTIVPLRNKLNKKEKLGKKYSQDKPLDVESA